MLLCGWFGTRTGVRGLDHPVPCPFICLLSLLYHALSKNTRFISDYFTRNSGGRWPPLRFFWTSPRRKAPVPPQGKASFRKEVPQCANWGGGLYFAAGEMYEINKVCKTLFTSYVLLRKTQSSVSLRLTAPFKRGLLVHFQPAAYAAFGALASACCIWGGRIMMRPYRCEGQPLHRGKGAVCVDGPLENAQDYRRPPPRRFPPFFSI